jgi:hypothetical protein
MFNDKETKRLEALIHAKEGFLKAEEDPRRQRSLKNELDGLKHELADYRPKAELFAQRVQLLAKVKTAGLTTDLQTQLKRNADGLRMHNVRDADIPKP